MLLAGDTHGNTAHVRYLLEVAVKERCERIFQLGDFGYWEHDQWGVEYLDKVNEYAMKHGVTVYFIDGNHDKTSLLLENYSERRDDEGFILVRPEVRYAPRGHTWTWEGKKFIALGGAYSVDKDYRLDQEKRRRRPPGTYWFPEEEMTDTELRNIIASTTNTVDFMFTHDKPRASNPAWNRKDLEQCWPNQNRIQEALEALKPHLLVHGHLHHRYDDAVMTAHGKTQVLGLDADPQTAGLFYRVENSWEVLELP